jgi:tetratricopeptide (TPR) repeat protein
MTIYEVKAPGSVSVAASYDDIGIVYQNQDQLEQALGCYQKSLAIKETKAPNSLDVAVSYKNIGVANKKSRQAGSSYGILSEIINNPRNKLRIV